MQCMFSSYIPTDGREWILQSSKNPTNYARIRVLVCKHTWASRATSAILDHLSFCIICMKMTKKFDDNFIYWLQIA